MTVIRKPGAPLVGAARRHECERCGHFAHVEAIFGKGYYFWPPAPMCPHCQSEMPLAAGAL